MNARPQGLPAQPSGRRPDPDGAETTRPLPTAGPAERDGAVETPENLATAALLRVVLHREAAAVPASPSPDGLARILAAARTAPAADVAAEVRPEVIPEPASDGGPDAPEPTDADAPDLAGDPPEPEPLPTAELPAPGRLRRLVPRPRRGGSGGAGSTRAALAGTRWLPALATAAAVATIAGGLGAVRMGVIDGAVPAVLRGSPAESTPQPPGGASPLPVYLVARQQGRWALVREFAPTGLADRAERLTEALRMAVSGVGSNPELASAWSVQSVSGDLDAELGERGITVHLSTELLATRPVAALPGAQPSTGATTDRRALAELAVQQLVWTATAVTGRDVPVRIEGPAPTSSLFDALPIGRDFTRAGTDPRAPAWISSVIYGQHLRTGIAVVTGDAVTTGDGTVAWSLAGPNGRVTTGAERLVRDDGSTARAGERGVFRLRLPLKDKGTYRLSVSQLWPAPGGGPVSTWTQTTVVDAG